MKKLIIPIIAAATLAVAAVTAEAKPAPTNAITPINLKLTFTSSISETNWITTKTNITLTGKTRTTNVITYLNTTDKSVSTPIANKDFVAALAPGAPKGAFLARVFNTNGAYYAIRAGGSNYLVVTNFSESVSNSVSFGTRKSTLTRSTYSPGATQVDFLTLTFTPSATSPLSFSLTGVATTTYTPIIATLDGFTTQVPNTTINVIGSGADAVGDAEIVTGTISFPAFGTTLGD